MVKIIILNERDIKIINEIQRWRFLLSRQIKVLGGFNGQRACDRRIKKLIEAGYIERKYIIHGVPRLYFITSKAVKLLDLEYRTANIRIEQIAHDIAVIDTAIFLINKENVDSASIITERDLKHKAGFGRCNKHFPDFTYTKDGHSCCVEIELSAKKLSTLEKNIKNNYVAYNSQRWYFTDNSKVQANITAVGKKYGVEIISLKGVTEFVRNL